MDGYYPSGSANPSHGFVPSGALLKAVIIHGGQPLDAITDLKDSSSTTWGDNIQGYGRSQIDTGLSFSPSTLRGLTYFVVGAADPTHEQYAELSSTSPPHKYEFSTQDIDNLAAIRVSSIIREINSDEIDGCLLGNTRVY